MMQGTVASNFTLISLNFRVSMLDIVPWLFLTVAVAISKASVVDMELTGFKFSLKRFLTCSAYSMLSVFSKLNL